MPYKLTISILGLSDLAFDITTGYYSFCSGIFDDTMFILFIGIPRYIHSSLPILDTTNHS